MWVWVQVGGWVRVGAREWVCVTERVGVGVGGWDGGVCGILRYMQHSWQSVNHRKMYPQICTNIFCSKIDHVTTPRHELDPLLKYRYVNLEIFLTEMIITNIYEQWLKHA